MIIQDDHKHMYVFKASLSMYSPPHYFRADQYGRFPKFHRVFWAETLAH